MSNFRVCVPLSGVQVFKMAARWIRRLESWQHEQVRLRVFVCVRKHVDPGQSCKALALLIHFLKGSGSGWALMSWNWSCRGLVCEKSCPNIWSTEKRRAGRPTRVILPNLQSSNHQLSFLFGPMLSHLAGLACLVSRCQYEMISSTLTLPFSKSSAQNNTYYLTVV